MLESLLDMICTRPLVIAVRLNYNYQLRCVFGTEEVDPRLIDPNESEHVYDRGSVNIAPTKFNGRQMDALTRD